jgi:hypothetical protein
MLLNRIEVMERPGVGYMRVIIDRVDEYRVRVAVPVRYGDRYDMSCGTHQRAMEYAVELCRQHATGELK